MALWRVVVLLMCGAALVMAGYKLSQSSPASPTSTTSLASPFVTPVASPGTFFPAQDGYVGREASPPETWEAIRLGAATTSVMNEPQSSAPYLRQQTPPEHYDILRRAELQFDTESLPDNAAIESARLEIYVNSLGDTLGDQAIIITSPDSGAFASLPALSSPILLRDIVPRVVLPIPLNDRGVAHISKPGVSRLAISFESDRAGSEPPWVGFQHEAYLNIDFVEGPHSPRLVVKHKDTER